MVFRSMLLPISMSSRVGAAGQLMMCWTAASYAKLDSREVKMEWRNCWRAGGDNEQQTDRGRGLWRLDGQEMPGQEPA